MIKLMVKSYFLVQMMHSPDTTWSVDCFQHCFAIYIYFVGCVPFCSWRHKEVIRLFAASVTSKLLGKYDLWILETTFILRVWTEMDQIFFQCNAQDNRILNLKKMQVPAIKKSWCYNYNFWFMLYEWSIRMKCWIKNNLLGQSNTKRFLHATSNVKFTASQSPRQKE